MKGSGIRKLILIVKALIKNFVDFLVKNPQRISFFCFFCPVKKILYAGGGQNKGFCLYKTKKFVKTRKNFSKPP